VRQNEKVGGTKDKRHKGKKRQCLRDTKTGQIVYKARGWERKKRRVRGAPRGLELLECLQRSRTAAVTKQGRKEKREGKKKQTFTKRERTSNFSGKKGKKKKKSGIHVQSAFFLIQN